MIAACTGHRPEKLGNDYMLTTPLSRWIKQRMIEILGNRRPQEAICGMALGSDTLWAMAAIELEIPLICVIPFEGQDGIWRPEHRRRYREILSKAVEVKVTGKRVEGVKLGQLMNKRNMYMVDQLCHPGDFLVSVFDGSPGGTYNTIKYAGNKEPSIEVINIDPRDFKTSKA